MYADNGGESYLCSSHRMLYFFIDRMVIIPFCNSEVTYLLISEFFFVQQCSVINFNKLGAMKSVSLF